MADQAESHSLFLSIPSAGEGDGDHAREVDARSTLIRSYDQ